jgi:signal transduction histidine kinase
MNLPAWLSSRHKARLAFASALVLLLVCGGAATITIVRLLESAKWIAHTYDVQVTLGDMESALSVAARTRTSFMNSGEAAYLVQYQEAKTQIHQKLGEVRELTKDNGTQQGFCRQLEDIILRRLELLDTSIEIRKSGPVDESTLLRLSRENIAVAADFMDVMQRMMQEERRILSQRREVSSTLFVTALGILLAMFALAILLFWIHFRLLESELAERERTEENARRLSGRLLQLQDEERRKFSRELHDSLGQLLAMAKIHLFDLLEKNPGDNLLIQIDRLLDQSITETRTISHLLHPPLLDEVGLSSAFRWYLEGFAQRSGIQVISDIPEDLGRFPRPVELALFRVLQESLTNIHRHAKSPRAEVSLHQGPAGTTLRIRDFGRGIARETLRNFRSTGTRVGVGLAGMREHVREQGGLLDVHSDSTGTTVTVIIPASALEDAQQLEATASSSD